MAIISVWWEWVANRSFLGDVKISPGNKSGDSFNLYLQKSSAPWETILRDHFSCLFFLWTCLRGFGLTAERIYSQSSNYDKRSVKPSSYCQQKLTQYFISLFDLNLSHRVPKVKNVRPTDFWVEKWASLFTERNLDNADLWSIKAMRSSFKTINVMVNYLSVLCIFSFWFIYVRPTDLLTC